MYKNKTILGMIPARGGSKGLPGKNIKKLLDKPLIAWTIEQALGSKYLDKVIVNTDDEKIATIAKGFGAKVPFLRPKALASDNSRVIDTVLHTLDYFEKKVLSFDYLCLLEPTSPLRKGYDIDNAIKKLVDNQDRADSLISVGEIALEHPIYVKKINKNGYLASFFRGKGYKGGLRQELPIAYFPYGLIYISKVPSIRKYNSVYGGRALPYLIERWQNYEINDIFDFLCIETILKERNKGNTK